MVWGFGGNDKPSDIKNFAQLAGAENSGNGRKNDQEPKSFESTYSFNSEALERAAKAAKELDGSPNVKQLLQLQNTAEQNRKLELENQRIELAANVERIRLEELRKSDRERLEQQAKINQQKAQYEDQLARKRYEDQLNRERVHQEDSLRRQNEAVAQQEDMKRKTADYKLKKESELRMKEIEAKFKGRAVYEQENYKIHQEGRKLDAEQKRITVLESIKTASTVIGEGFRNWQTVKSAVVGLTLVAGGIFAAKHSVSLVAKAIEARIGKPQLLKETSRLNAIDFLSHPIKSIKRIIDSRRPEDALKNVIFDPSVEAKLRDIAIATRNTKLNQSTYRNLMFFGPPGTGKTLFARRLAQHSGMDFAMFTGGDIGHLGKSAVPQIHKVFDWSQTSRRGLLLFIDEAEAFLSSRRSMKISEDLHQVVDAFLNRTGDQSKHFMFVLSTNLPNQLDEAIEDRIDEEIKFGLPSLDERKRLMRLYFDQYVLEPASSGGRRALKVEKIDFGELCDRIAVMIDGLSGRAISKLNAAFQADAYASADRLLTEEKIMKRVNEFIPMYLERLKRRM